MPGWQRTFKPFRKDGKLAIAGIVQEQHADRARLYAQWRGIKWPILVDSLNLYGNRVVPIVMGVDEAGRVAVVGIRSKAQLEAFLAAPPARPVRREPDALPSGATEFLAGDWNGAVDKFGKGDSAEAHFRTGVALRARSESEASTITDAQGAVVEWQTALAMNPNQYIWRRRIQQYGPRLAKPYNFYGWVAEARRAIKARGETPHSLRVEPRGAELIDRTAVASAAPAVRDPEGKIDRDKGRGISVESVVTPARVRPGDRVRVRLTFRPGTAKWNNEGQALTAVFRCAGFQLAEGDLVHPLSKTPHSSETRVLECEILVGKQVKSGRHVLGGYALYDVCIDEDGTCRYLRQDLTVSIHVDPSAVRLGR